MKKYLWLGGALLAIGLAIGLLFQQGYLPGSERYLFRKIKNEPALVSLFNKARAREADIAKDPEKAAWYFDLGLYWKSIAEQHGQDKDFYKKSLAVYEDGIKRFGDKNILFYLNAGKLAEHLQDFNLAERYYKKAIELSPGDESGYLDLVDLYYYHLHKSKEETLAVFSRGMEKMVNPITLIAGRATYLNRLGDYAEALKDYQTLVKTFPDRPGYQQMVAEIEAKLQAQK